MKVAALLLRVGVWIFALFAILVLLPGAAFAVSQPTINTQPQSQSVLAGANAVFTVDASGPGTLTYQWSFNGADLTNGGRISGATGAQLMISDVLSRDAGNYQVVVANSHGTTKSSVAALTVTFTNHAHFVTPNNSTPIAPYGDWSSAATNIQDAVDAADPGDLIYVTNGIYHFGNRVTSVTTNCLVATNAVSIIGVSGAVQTVIDGGGSNRCVYLGGGASLTGFTLTNGVISESGGGVYCESTSETIADCVLERNACGGQGRGGGVFMGTLTNCTLMANSASIGGGAEEAVLNHCIVTGNSSAGGGGAAFSTLNDCLVSSNNYWAGWGTSGGGALYCTLNNCTLVGNRAASEGGGVSACTLSNCVLVANSARDFYGGAAEYSTLYHCVLSNNVAGQWAGGAWQSTLYDCLITSNNAAMGGGAKDSTLISCLVSNNAAPFGYGGGAHSCTLSNCVVIGNYASDAGGGANGSTVVDSLILSNSAASGGGANGSSLYNCLLTGNASVLGGGGAAQCTLINCTVTGNSATNAGAGVVSSALTNCIVFDNHSPAGANYSGTNYMSWCCTTPLSSSGPGDVVLGVSNISASPVFADAAHGNYHLYPGSPGIDVGNNSFAPDTVDLDGDSRIVNGTVDLGAYEFQNFPFIETQPTNQTIALGTPSLSFSAEAFGSGTLAYQWMFNGTNIADATNATLTLNFVQYGDAGTYSVLVTNDFGATLSSDAVLTVVPPTRPDFVLQPANQMVPTETNITLTTAASGAPAPAYQWFFNGAMLADDSHYSDAATAMLEILNTRTNDTGNYYVIATNLGGTATSSVAVVTVLLPPTVMLQPENQTLMQGASVTFTATADGGAPLAYQWLFDGAPLTDGGQMSGATTMNLTVSNLQFTNGGNYALSVINPVGSATSIPAALTVLARPQISQSPTNANVLLDSNAVFSAVAMGTQPIGYQWFFHSAPLSDGLRLSGSASNSLSISDVKTNDAGSYFVVATNAYGSVTSSVANLTVWLPAVITQQPSNQTVAIGSTISLTVAADGTGPFGYQWFFNDVPLVDGGRLSGSATNSLNILNAQKSETGSYYVVVTNLLSSATSSIVNVSVLVPPGITLQPIGRSTPLGLATTYTANASGDSPLTYQWQLNNTNIPGATNTSYTIAAVGTNDLGVYQFTASNAADIAVSSNAWLTVGPVAAWGRNDVHQCLPPPGLSNVVQIAGGNYNSLALRLDGSLTMWGNNLKMPFVMTNIVMISENVIDGALALHSDGTVTSLGSGPVAPATLSNAVAVAAGNYYGLALRADGTVVGWGAGTYAERWPSAAYVPTGLTHVTAIAAGVNQSLALRDDGTVVAWGIGPGTNIPPGLSNVVAIASGPTHGLALKSDGTVVAWGATSATNVPPGLSNIVAIAAGGYPQGNGQSLAVRSDGTVVAWGDNSYGETTVPSGLTNVVAVAGGAYHSLALVNDGKPQILRPPVGGTVWSGNDWTLQVTAAGVAPLHYQWLFNGTNVDGATNSTLLLSAVQTANAGNYQVIVSNALGVATSLSVPVSVVDSAPILLTQSPANMTGWLGNKLSLTVAAVGSMPLQYQWRRNDLDIPTATNDTLNFDRLHLADTGDYLFIASNSFGAVTSSVIHLTVQQIVAWGDNSYGQTTVPSGLTNAVAISAGLNSSIALRADGTVTVWGNNNFATNTVGISNIVEVSASQGAYLALNSESRLHVWGYVSYGVSNLVSAQSNIVSAIFWDNRGEFLRADGTLLQIYNGLLETNNYVTNGIALENYDNNYLVLRSDGTVYDPFGLPPNVFTNVCSLGASKSFRQITALKRDGTVAELYAPLLSTNLSHVIGVTSAGYSSLDLAVLSDGSVAWGQQAGFPPPNPATNVPTGLRCVQSLDAGYKHCVALLSDKDFPPVLLPVALDTANIVVSSKGSPQWLGETNISHDGISAAQSADIGNNLSSSMRMWVAGAVTVKFWWKVSSATNHGVLSFSAGGMVLTNVSGNVDWQLCTVTVPQGNQILQWTYSKDGTAAAGKDAGWVDQLQVFPVAPKILAQPQPVSQNVVGGTNVDIAYSVTAMGTPPLSYSWKKNGNLIFTGPSTNLILTRVSRADSGAYSVEIVSPYGTTNSDNAVLEVHVPQLLGTPVFQPDGTLLFSSADEDGTQLSVTDLTNLQVQASSNLVNWVTLPNTLVLTNGAIELQDAGATNYPTRFYRILENW